VVCLLAAIAVSAYNTRKSIDPHLFVRTPVAGYFISLLLFDIIQGKLCCNNCERATGSSACAAIGSIINAAWTKRHMVEFGSLCVAQGDSSPSRLVRSV
jgi:hypothetical protein